MPPHLGGRNERAAYNAGNIQCQSGTRSVSKRTSGMRVEGTTQAVIDLYNTRGCASWSFPVRDGDRVLNVVSASTLKVMARAGYAEQGADLERSLRVRRSLPAEIWTSHARLWGSYRKFVARDMAENPTDPFIDPEGYRAYVDNAGADATPILRPVSRWRLLPRRRRSSASHRCRTGEPAARPPAGSTCHWRHVGPWSAGA